MRSISRRTFIAAAMTSGVDIAMAQPGANDARSPHAIEVLERHFGGRLGVAFLDTGSGRRMGYRADEAFPMCSTFKFLVGALVLSRVDRGEESQSRRIAYSQRDLLSYAPTTSKHLADGMTVGDLCEAAITLSDNTAANLLLASFGGPAALTQFMRSTGDVVTRLDRNEPSLNEAAPGDPRDTTTPDAMLAALQKFVLGDALSTSSRATLTQWLIGCRTGDTRLRAGVPADWRVGDKTGTGDHNTANDIGIFWPPGRAPLIVTAFYTQSRAKDVERDAVLAEAAHLAIGAGSQSEH